MKSRKTSYKTVRLSSYFTVGRVEKLIADKDRKTLATFMRQRLRERYIDPVRTSRKKNGFALMATACLLVETLECFYKGWASTEKKGRSKKAFKDFFERDTRFFEFKGLGEKFYKEIRCGILHQGETKKGWKIRRNGPLFDKRTRTVNSVKFLNRLNGSIGDYARTLEAPHIEQKLWNGFKTKMKRTIAQCKD